MSNFLLNKNKYDPEYISYIKNGESAAVYIVRDIATSINTEKRWVHILDKCDDTNYNGQRRFNYIVCELFDRKIMPKYPKSNEYSKKDYKAKCKYITWQTAHEDIQKQKIKGAIGSKYLLLCKLVNRSKGKFIWEDAWWNTTFESWVNPGWSKTPSCILKRRKRYIEPDKPKWEYEIISVKKLSQNEVDYVLSHKYDITCKIESQRKVKIDFFSGSSL